MLAAVAGLIGWNYGAMFTLFPATLLQYYGATAQAPTMVCCSPPGRRWFLRRFRRRWLKDLTGSFFVPFIVSAVILVISVIILASLKAPEKKAA